MALSDRRPAFGETDIESIFIGFETWAVHGDEWELVYAAMIETTFSHPFHRTVWRDTRNPEFVVLVDITERDSRREASRALSDRLEWNSQSELLQGPDGLGDYSLHQREGGPPATFFVRGNLAVLVVNQGPEHANTTQVAVQLDEGMVHQPQHSLPVSGLTATPADPAAGDEVTLRFTDPWDTPADHYFKFFVQGATVRRNAEGDVVITRPLPGLAQVVLYGITRDGEAVSGSLEIEFSAATP